MEIRMPLYFEQSYLSSLFESLFSVDVFIDRRFGSSWWPLFPIDELATVITAQKLQRSLGQRRDCQRASALDNSNCVCGIKLE